MPLVIRKERSPSAVWGLGVIIMLVSIFLVVFALVQATGGPDTSYTPRTAEVMKVTGEGMLEDEYVYHVETSKGDSVSIYEEPGVIFTGQQVKYWCNTKECFDSQPPLFRHIVFWPILVGGILVLLLGLLAFSMKWQPRNRAS